MEVVTDKSIIITLAIPVFFLLIIVEYFYGRYVGKNTGIMNHQHSDTMESKMHDMKAQMKENTNCEQRCMQILRDATGYSLSDVRKKFNNPSDQYFTAKQLIDLKIADHIL